MSTFSSFFPSKFLPSMNPRDRDNRPQDPLSRLRFALETMPGSRKYVFTPATRAEILSELYDAFWGPYGELFVGEQKGLGDKMLSEVQASIARANNSTPGKETVEEEEPVVPGRPCGHIFTKGESCFRCKDCALDDSCVLCSRCFHATDHGSHNVSFFIAQQSGGCCDCGDEEAWRVSINCPYHPPSTSVPTTSTIPSPVHSHQIGTFPDVPPVANYPYRYPIPSLLQETATKTVAYALDFLLDTLDYSPDEPIVPGTPEELRAQPSMDPMMKDVYCVVVWNDDKHSFGEVTQLICELGGAGAGKGKTREEAGELARRIDEFGREVVEMNTNVVRLLEMAQGIAHIDLGVTIRRAYDTFREQVAAVIIEWLLDLTRSRIGRDRIVLREIVAAELLKPRNGTGRGKAREGLIEARARLDWMFLYHTRLWKKPRLSLKEIYASILTLSRNHKHAVAGHFANVYHRVIDAYLLVDREAETSIKYFALQLFTVPSVALHIVTTHNLVSRLLNIITAFFTNQIDEKEKRIRSQPSSEAEVDVDSFPFKSKRFMPVFSDLRYLCHNSPVQALIATQPIFLSNFANTCTLFMCVNPNKRVVNSHVEYETEAWISVFNVTLSLSRVIKVYGEAFNGARVGELVGAITLVMHKILMICTLSDDRLDRSKFSPVSFHEVEFGGTRHEVVKFDVMEGWVSFHHSLHWLLAELFKHVDLLSDGSLNEVGLGGLKDVVLRNASEQAWLTVIDFPLRVLAMIAQIRTGLWVRNGFAIRGQLLHYRDFMLRELCYDQDIFILQTALVILDPSLVFVTVLDRFGLVPYFTGAIFEASYEGPQLGSMVEEVLYLLIALVSENSNAKKMPLRTAVRREIVHALAMGPCSFTDLVKRVAERMVDDVCFEQVLREVANFKPPDGTTDTGVYELKDEAFQEVNPFFYHYTRNKREEVEVVLQNRMMKKGVKEAVIVPKQLGIEQGPFEDLAASFESEALLQVMFYGIFNILVLTESSGTTPPSAEAILDQSLHLVMLALVERPIVFCRLAAVKSFEEDKNLIDVICTLEHHEKYKAYNPRVEWILARLEEHVPEEIQARRRVLEADRVKSPDPADAKKRAAKARQDAIMKQMKAQQADFAFNFDEDEDDEDMEDTPEEHVSYGTCIVCQEDLNGTRHFGGLALLQPSRLIRRHPDSHNLYLNEVLQTAPSMDRSPVSAPDTSFPPPDAHNRDIKSVSSTNFEGFPVQYTRFGLHSSVCGHMMHLDCFQTYSVSIRQRHRAQATRNHPENIPRKEFICPLCKSLGNIILPITRPSTTTTLSTTPFPDWIRAAGIGILRSKPDPTLDSLQFRNGTGEFVFWSAQDPGYISYLRHSQQEAIPDPEIARMVDTIMVVSKNLSQQTRHLRDRPEPEPGERGAGIYLPEEVVGYSIAAIEVAHRGTESQGLIVDSLTDQQLQMIRGILVCLAKIAAMQLKGRSDGGRDAIKQAIIKRLLPEWSRTSLTSFSYPLLLRDPFTVLVETAAVAPEMLRHVLVLTYYACLARTVIGLVYVLNKTRSYSTVQIPRRNHEDIFGDVRMFFMSVVRHSPVFEHTATLVLETFGEARIEKLLYAFTLPFLRRAAILCRAVLPSAFPTPFLQGNEPCEYNRLLSMLGIPALSDLPNQDTLQNALSGWCAHYGHSHAASQLNCGVVLDYPATYRIARLPVVLDNLFGGRDKAMKCSRCETVPVDAAICLICGTTCCMQSHCCIDGEANDRGECNMHTRECGGAIGVYFLVKRCSLLYLYAGNGTFAQSPYLDVHGEVDVSMRRGRRQYLHHARWEEVRKIWLNHGVPTVVARKLESTVDSGGWETL